MTEIIDNAERIATYLDGVSLSAFVANGLLRDATEAVLNGYARRHAYDRISPAVVWNTACHDLPGLVADARVALQRLTAENGPPAQAVCLPRIAVPSALL